MSASLSTVYQNIASWLWCFVCVRWSIDETSKQVYWSLRYWMSVHLHKICSCVWISPERYKQLSVGIRLHLPVSSFNQCEPSLKAFRIYSGTSFVKYKGWCLKWGFIVIHICLCEEPAGYIGYTHAMITQAMTIQLILQTRITIMHEGNVLIL